MKIHQEDIAWYLKTAPHLGTAIGAAADAIYFCDDSISSLEVRKVFASHILAVYPEAIFPFAQQLNTLNEYFDQTICVSVNNCVAHGKNTKEIYAGDFVSLDGGMSLRAPTGREMYFDAAITLKAGRKHSDRDTTLIQAPLKALKEIGKFEGEINTLQIATIIENVAKENNLGIVTSLTGHGIGYKLHTQPRISNVPAPNMVSSLIPNTFICPEPMYTANGNGEPVRSYLDADGWSVIVDNISSHWETAFYYDGNKLIDTVGIISNY